MTTNLYVGNLSYDTNEDELRNMFAEFGTISHLNIISDDETGKSKGFGFVEMENDAEAAVAIQQMHGKEVAGRPLKVNEARPRTET